MLPLLLLVLDTIQLMRMKPWPNGYKNKSGAILKSTTVSRATNKSRVSTTSDGDAQPTFSPIDSVSLFNTSS